MTSPQYVNWVDKLNSDPKLKIQYESFIDKWEQYNRAIPENNWFVLSKTSRFCYESARLQGLKRGSVKWVNSPSDYFGCSCDMNYVILCDFEYPEWYYDFIRRSNTHGWNQYHW